MMPADSELDALIADNVMRDSPSRQWCELCECHVFTCTCQKGKRVAFPYSTDIAYAWRVAEKFEKEGWQVSLMGFGDWECSLSIGDSNCHHAKPYDSKDGHGYTYIEENAKTAPHAICIAAMKTIV